MEVNSSKGWPYYGNGATEEQNEYKVVAVRWKMRKMPMMGITAAAAAAIRGS